jgi:hypothetical protein
MDQDTHSRELPGESATCSGFIGDHATHRGMPNLTPLGSVPASVIIGVGLPAAVTVKLPPFRR